MRAQSKSRIVELSGGQHFNVTELTYFLDTVVTLAPRVYRHRGKMHAINQETPAKKTLAAVADMQTRTWFAPVAQKAATDRLFPRIWPVALIVLGFVLTAVWVALLGYGVISLISLAF